MGKIDVHLYNMANKDSSAEIFTYKKGFVLRCTF